MKSFATPSRKQGLRVAYLFTQYPIPSQTFATSDIEALRDIGCEVDIYTLKLRPRNSRELEKRCGVPADLPIHRPTLAGALGWPLQLWKYRNAFVDLLARSIRNLWRSPGSALEAIAVLPRALEVADQIAQSETEVVHAFWTRHQSLVLAILAHSNRQIVRSTFVGAYDLVAADHLVSFGLEKAEIAFTHARTNLPAITAIDSGSKPEVVHRGIPLPDWQPGAEERDSSLWVTAGSLVRQKNFEAVIDAFAIARRSRPGLQLEIYGEGPHRAQIEAYARDTGCDQSVTLCGYISRSQLIRRMAQAQVFLLLSTKDSERLPNVVKEALWAGCAPILSKTPGIDELVPGELGHLVDLDHPGSLEQAVRAVLVESTAQARLRRSAARSMIESKFDASIQMARYLECWSQLLDRRAKDAS